jgi:hypothetical protein
MASTTIDFNDLGLGRIQSDSFNRFLDWVSWILILAPLAFQTLLVYRYGVNMPISVEWDYAPFVRSVAEGGPWWQLLWHQLRENHFVVSMLIMAANVHLTGWNVVAQMYLALIPSALSLLGLWFIYRRITSASAWYFIPAAWLLVNIRQYENYLFGIQIGFLLALTGVIWTAYCLSRGTTRSFAAAVVIGFLTIFSAASGLFVWVMGLAQLIGRRAPWHRLGLWVVVSAIAYTIYFYGFATAHQAGAIRETLAEPQRLVEFALALLGSVLEPYEIARAQLFGGIFALAVLAFMSYTLLRRRYPTQAEWAAVALVVFALVAATVISLGRTHRDLIQSLAPRYVSYTVLGFVGLYLIFASRCISSQYRRVFAWGVVPLCLVGLLGLNLSSLEGAQYFSRTFGRMNFYIARTQDLDSHKVRNNLYSKKIFEDNLEDIYWLRSNSLSLYRDQPQWWLILPRVNPKPLPPLTSALPIVQTFRCPVETLHDVSVDVFGYTTPGTLSMQLIDARDNRRLAARSVETGTLSGARRLLMRLDSPLTNCRDIPLRLELVSDSTSPNTLTAFRYPVFYDGTLTQAGRVIANASLGMELNTQAYDIRDGQ